MSCPFEKSPPEALETLRDRAAHSPLRGSVRRARSDMAGRSEGEREREREREGRRRRRKGHTQTHTKKRREKRRKWRENGRSFHPGFIDVSPRCG